MWRIGGPKGPWILRSRKGASHSTAGVYHVLAIGAIAAEEAVWLKEDAGCRAQRGTVIVEIEPNGCNVAANVPLETHAVAPRSASAAAAEVHVADPEEEQRPISA